MSEEVKLAISTQVASISEFVRNSNDGEYFVSDVNLTSLDIGQGRMLSRLLMSLVSNFPEYQWQQQESLDPNQRGILIKWRRKSW